MATFVLIPGAGGSAWYWHRLVPELRSRGHDAIAVELPTADEAAGIPQYAEAVLDAIGDRTDGLVVVAQSMGAYTGPLVCERAPVELLALLNPMIPQPGESAGDWWEATGQPAAREEQAAREGRDLGRDRDLLETFFHDVPSEVTNEAIAQGEPEQSATPFGQPWPLQHWPDVPIRILQGRDDRLFPAEFQRRVARERLAITPEEMPGGHLVALSQPAKLADRLVELAREHVG
jgi:pimeloyl-ACP methyl ester carboxylesterase